MPFSQDLKITPLSLTRFIKAYDLSISAEENAQAYGIYLETNKNQHHYNGFTVQEWLIKEIVQYLKG